MDTQLRGSPGSATVRNSKLEREGNPEIQQFEGSCFDGKYITGDVTGDYLQLVEESRNDVARTQQDHNLDVAEVSTYI